MSEMRSTLFPSQKAILAMSRSQYIAHQKAAEIPSTPASTSERDTNPIEKISIGICIYRLDGKTLRPAVLLLRRTPRWWHQYMAPSDRQRGGYWELPGGKMEDDDFCISAAIERLVREQTGLRVTKILGLLDELRWSTDVKELLWEDEDEDDMFVVGKLNMAGEDEDTECSSEWEDDLVETSSDGESEMVQVGLEIKLEDFDCGRGIIMDDLLHSFDTITSANDILGIRFADSVSSSSSKTSFALSDGMLPPLPPKDDRSLKIAPLMLASSRRNAMRPRSRKPLPQPIEIPPPLPAVSPLRRRAVGAPPHAELKPRPLQTADASRLNRPLPHVANFIKPRALSKSIQDWEDKDAQKKSHRYGFIQAALRPVDKEEDEKDRRGGQLGADKVQRTKHVQLNFSVLVDEEMDTTPPFLIQSERNRKNRLTGTVTEQDGHGPKYEHDALDWATFSRLKTLPMCEDLRDVVRQGLTWADEALG
ncbi:hypothetical protein F5Y16DRAFT_374285 [Xylariaceae sp. FL0255]|nr:hypothetical protein F5Y16DRAFT_374285 [Xylariaceae sp. FL0255]